MLAAYLAAAAIALACLLVGQAACALCGRRLPSALAPAVGLSMLLAATAIAVKLPGRAATAAAAAVALVVASIAVLAWRRPALSGAAVGPALAALAAAFAISIPFLVSGRVGILGMGLVNDDMASHLLFADWLDRRAGEEPELISDGYPLGPHALVAATARLTGASTVATFAGLSIAAAGLAALTAYGALGGLRGALRAPAAALAAVPYLAAVYYAQGAFKEPMLALLIVAFALGLGMLRSERALLQAVPLGLIAAGALYLYSFPGLAWLGATALAWGALIAVAERRERGGLRVRERLRGARPAIAVAVAIPLLTALPEVGRLISFTDFRAFNPEGGDRVGLGNLREAISPLQALGVWPSSEFRASAAAAGPPAIVFYLGGVLAATVVAVGTVGLLRRREPELPAALAAVTLGYLAAVALGTPYTSAKALAIAAPVAMLTALRGLALQWRPQQRPEQHRERPERPLIGRISGRPPAGRGIPGRSYAGRAGVSALAAVFVAGAAISSLLPLRQAAVGPDTHTAQLAALRPAVEDRGVIFIGRSSFAAWALQGSRVATPVLHHYNAARVEPRFRATPTRAKFDFDSVTPASLSRFRYAIAPKGSFASAPPADFRRVAATPDYTLWERRPDAPVPEREVLREPDSPGAVLDCATPEGRRLAASGGTAVVISPPPVAGPQGSWRPSDRVADGSPASQELVLTPGRWSISLQYASTRNLELRATTPVGEPLLTTTLAPLLDFRGPAPFWPVGELEVTARGPVRFELDVDPPTRFGRLIGAEGQAFPGRIAAMPVAPRRRMPLRQACGRYVDHYTPPPG